MGKGGGGGEGGIPPPEGQPLFKNVQTHILCNPPGTTEKTVAHPRVLMGYQCWPSRSCPAGCWICWLRPPPIARPKWNNNWIVGVCLHDLKFGTFHHWTFFPRDTVKAGDGIWRFDRCWRNCADPFQTALIPLKLASLIFIIGSLL